MASMDQSLTSGPIGQKWVGEISEILNQQLEIDIRITPISIFRIPESTIITKPEAYKPQQIGLGPYHHFRPEPYTKMEQTKLRLLQGNQNIKDFRLTVVDKVQKLVPAIRYCYETLLEDDNVSMAWVFAIDGVFLLNVFDTYRYKLPTQANPTDRLWAQDIMMIENQIPFMVLKEIYEALHASSDTNVSPLQEEVMEVAASPFYSDSSRSEFLLSTFRSFSEIHSPLELCSQSQAPTYAEHLLHYMYLSIIKNIHAHSLRPVTMESVGGLDYIAGSSSLVIASITGVSNFVRKVPHKQIVQLYEQSTNSLEIFTRNKTTFPSASELQGRAGFRFHVLPKDNGKQKIIIDDDNVYLPCFILNANSEVILRNLVAYETLVPKTFRFSNFPLTEYMGLMCGLVVNVDDVKLLKKDLIIKSDLSEDKVANIFTGMRSYILSLNCEKETRLQGMIDKVNNVYYSRPMMRTYLLLKKLANWVLVVLRPIGRFVGATWKIVLYMATTVSVFILTYQAYCDVFGCDKVNAKLLSYASS